MKMKKIYDSLYIAWTIAQKDITDALKNKNTRTNILLVIAIVVFFYWASTIRPWDKSIEVVVYDQSESGLFEGTIELSNDYEIRHIEVSSIEQMQRNMRFEHWGLVIPADFEGTLASGGEPVLTGYVLWRNRGKVAELETLYKHPHSLRGLFYGSKFGAIPDGGRKTDQNHGCYLSFSSQPRAGGDG